MVLASVWGSASRRCSSSHLFHAASVLSRKVSDEFAAPSPGATTGHGKQDRTNRAWHRIGVHETLTYYAFAGHPLAEDPHQESTRRKMARDWAMAVPCPES